MDFRQEFEKQLEEIYLGKIKDIKGDGGYINLINIKSQFYNDILKVINNCERDLIPPNNPEWTNNDQRDYLMLIYEHIFTFFSKYLNDTGTPFYSKVKSYNGTYAPVYKDDDVSLFWKTQDLYYVKSEKLFDEMSFEIDQTNYYFNVDELKRQTSNEKLIYKFFIDINDITVTEDDNGMKRYHLIIKVLSNKTDKSLFDSLIDLNTDKGLKEFKKEYLEINKYYGNADEKDLIDAIRKYQRQSDIDYFIHKNAKSFLEEQLDLYMYNVLGKDMITEFTADLITRYQHIRILASTIIDYIARFENELKSMWEKPKLVKNSNYIITLDKLSSDLVDKLKSESPNSLKDEWIELGFIDNNWTYNNITDDKYKTLPIDTKHLSSTLKYDILASFDDLEKYVDGVLIKSDNYQALQTLQAKYNSKIDLIYIDPPFNTGEDFAYKDGFQDSTWITLMENRLELAKTLLSDQGSFYLHLDYRANYLGRQILDLQFGYENYRNDIIWHYTGSAAPTADFQRKHDNIFRYTKYEDCIFNYLYDSYDKSTIRRFDQEDENGKFKLTYRDGNTYKTYMKEGKRLDEVWDIPIVMKTSAEYIDGVLTQKPEALLERIIKTSSEHDSIIMDYFSGSGTTINTAHKLGRKWIGIEMGEHFHSVILPRVKKTLFGVISGISKELQKNNALKIGGFVKYYELESYDDVLTHAEYKQWDNINDALIWDEKLSKALVFNSDNTITFDFSQIGDSYQNFADEHTKYSDIAETLSNLFGADIIKLDHNKLYLKGIEGHFDMNNLNFADEKITHLKKLIWWESI